MSPGKGVVVTLGFHMLRKVGQSGTSYAAADAGELQQPRRRRKRTHPQPNTRGSRIGDRETRTNKLRPRVAAAQYAESSAALSVGRRSGEFVDQLLKLVKVDGLGDVGGEAGVLRLPHVLR